MNQRPVKSWGTCPVCGHGPVFLYSDDKCGACTKVTPKEHQVGGQAYTGKKGAPHG